MSEELYLYAYQGAGKKVDAAIARIYVRDGWVPAPRTVLKGQKKVILAALPKVVVSPEELPDVLHRTIIKPMRAVSQKRCCVMLSGGFDSMLMVLLAKRLGASVEAVTIKFEDFNLSTVRDAIVLAKRLRLPHVILEVSLTEFLSSFQANISVTDEPSLDMEMALVHAAFKKYQGSFRKSIFISGMGSDQWLGDLAMEERFGGLQQRLDRWWNNKDAHQRVANLFGHRFIFPFITKELIALSLQIPTELKKGKQMLRMLAPAKLVVSSPAGYREQQIPDAVRAVLVRAYGDRAWPRPIKNSNPPKFDDKSLRSIVLGMWLEKLKDQPPAFGQ